MVRRSPSTGTLVVPRPKHVQEAEQALQQFLKVLKKAARRSSAERREFAERHHQQLVDIYVMCEPFATARHIDIKLDLLQQQGVF
jgi:uncharacterized membrane protein